MPSPARYNIDSAVKYMEPLDGHRVRSYSVSGKEVTKCSDSVRVRRNPSNVSVSSTSSGYESRGRNSRANSTLSDLSLNTQYIVSLLGMYNVGKTSLLQQFISSDQKCGHEKNAEMANENKCVSVILDGEEAELTFLDYPTSDRTSEDVIRDYDADAFIILYSVTDKESHSRANDILKYLEDCDLNSDKAVILVGNKSDLARSRTVTAEEGKALAVTYGCKFIEISAWLGHNVDELLVGITRQIRLRQKFMKRQEKRETDDHRYRRTKTLSRSRSLVRHIFQKLSPKSKSCSNLLVL